MAHPDPVAMRNLILTRLGETGSNPGWAGMQDWLQITRGICNFIENGGSSVSDHLVITSNGTGADTPGSLINKIYASTGISIGTIVDGGVTKLSITNTAPAVVDDHLVIASAGTGTDTPGSLVNKIYASTGISIGTIVDGGVTKLSITNTAPGVTPPAFGTDNPLPDGIATSGVNNGRYAGEKHVHPVADIPYGNLFLRAQETPEADNSLLRTRDSSLTEVEAIIVASTPEADRLIFSGSTVASDPNVAVWSVGWWKYRLWLKTNGIAPARVTMKMYRFEPVGNTYTELDSFTTAWFNNTSFTLIERWASLASNTQDAGDLVYVRAWAETESVSTVVVSLLVGGANNSYINCPLVTPIALPAPDDHLVISSTTDATPPGGLLEKTKQGGGTILTETIDILDGDKKKLLITSAEFGSDDPLADGIASPGVNANKFAGDKHVHPIADTLYGTFYLSTSEGVPCLYRDQNTAAAQRNLTFNSTDPLPDLLIFDGYPLPSTDPILATWPAGTWKYRLWAKTDGVAPVRFTVKMFRYTLPPTNFALEIDSYTTDWFNNSVDWELIERWVGLASNTGDVADTPRIMIWAETESGVDVTASISLGGGQSSHFNCPLFRPMPTGGGGTDDHMVLVRAADPTPEYLEDKITSSDGSIIISTISDPFGDQVNLRVATCLVTYADVDFRTVTPVDIKAGGDGVYSIGGINFTSVNIIEADASYCSAADGLHIGCRTNGRFENMNVTGHNLTFIPRSVFGSPYIGALQDLWVWFAVYVCETTVRDPGAGVGPRIEGVGAAGGHFGFFANGFGNAFTGYLKRMRTYGYSNSYSIFAQSDTTPLELTVDAGEFPVFVLRVVNGVNVEGYSGQTSGSGTIWPTKAHLSLRQRYSPPSTDGIFGTSVWEEDRYHRIRICPGSGNYASDTFIEIKKLKIEAEILAG